MNSRKEFLIMGLVCLAVCGLALAGGVPDPNLYPNLNGDEIINFTDFAMMASNWQKTGVGLTGDFDDSNLVDYNDLSSIANYWLEGPPPLTVFEKFKAALAAGDIDKALTFIADTEKEKYTAALTQLQPYFPQMVAGMGNLIFISIDEYTEKYEMLHDEGGGVISSFPVYFSKDEHGKWKIYCF